MADEKRRQTFVKGSAKYRDKKEKAGKRQVALWLSGSDIAKLDELATEAGATRGDMVAKLINDATKNATHAIINAIATQSIAFIQTYVLKGKK